MKQRYLTIAVAFVFVLAAASCKKDLLNKQPYGVITDANYYKTADDLNTTLTAAYGYMATSGFPPPEAGIWAIGDCGSDDANKGGGPQGNQPAIYDISLGQQKTNNSMALLFWTNRYAMIAACNLVLDKQSVVTGDATTIKNIGLQAKYLRAFGYYQLVKNFGDIPMSLKYLDPAAVSLARSPASAVYAQIEQDLTDASALPTKTQWGTANDGKATSGAANALLGKVYMLEKKYPQAEVALKKVIDEGTYSLVADYGAIFRKATGDYNSTESIFDIKHKTNANGLGSLNYYFMMPFDTQIGGNGYDEPSDDLVAEYEKGDPRAIYSISFRGDVYPIGTTTYTQNNTTTTSGRSNRKFFIVPAERTSPSIFDEAKTNHIIRYAEVLLLYAEALNEDSKAAAALPWLNMVRTRARNTPAKDPQRISSSYDLTYTGTLLPDVTTTDQTALRTAIYHEERVELAMEGLRREYLVRTGRWVAKMLATKSALGASGLTLNQALLPIPQNEIDVSNGKLTQNPGY